MRIAVLSLLRLNSSRVKEKHIQLIGGIPLAERALQITKSVGRHDVFPIAAICPIDKPLIEIAKRVGVPILERSIESRNTENAARIWDQKFVDQMKKFDWVVEVNPCLPFLKSETIELGVVRIQGGESVSFMTAYRDRGFVWDENGKRVIGPHTMADTKTNPYYYSICHCLHVYPIEDLGDEARMVTRGILPVKREPQFLDIDTPDDLRLCQALRIFVPDHEVVIGVGSTEGGSVDSFFSSCSL